MSEDVQVTNADSVTTQEVLTTPTTQTSETKPEAKVYDEEYVKQLRAEAAKYRTDANKKEAELKTYKDKELTDAQRIEQAKTEAEQRANKLAEDLRKTKLENAVIKAAASVNLDPELALKLGDFTQDEDGTPKDIEASIQALIAKYPNLVSKAAPGNPTNPARGGELTPQQREADLRQKLYGGGGNPFDSAYVRR